MSIYDNLVEPVTFLKLTLNNDVLESANGKKYSIVSGIPVLLETPILTPHQQSELHASIYYMNKCKTFDMPVFCWGWALPWLNNNVISSDDVVVCIGGAFADDIPHIHTKHKFNIDHLVHEYVKYLPSLTTANIQHVACTSEYLPFRSGAVRCVYARNSLDHVCNPLQTIRDIYRVLKPDGLFVSYTYYNSNVINEHESTSIDDEFIKIGIESLFNIDCINMYSNKVGNDEYISVGIVGRKKENVSMSLGDEDIFENGKILYHFHSALFYERVGKIDLAIQNYLQASKLRPILKTDLIRIEYAKTKAQSLHK